MLTCPQDDFLLSHRQLRSEPQASTRCVKKLRAWFHNTGILEYGQNYNGAIAYDETKFVDATGDLVSLLPIAKSPLGRFLVMSPSSGLLRVAGLPVKPYYVH
jgi:hypothetical protein